MDIPVPDLLLSNKEWVSICNLLFSHSDQLNSPFHLLLGTQKYITIIGVGRISRLRPLSISLLRRNNLNKLSRQVIRFYTNMQQIITKSLKQPMPISSSRISFIALTSSSFSIRQGVKSASPRMRRNDRSSPSTGFPLPIGANRNGDS